MVNAIACLLGKIKEGTVNEEAARPLVNLVEQYNEIFERKLGKGPSSEIQASTKALQEFEQEFESKLVRSYRTVSQMAEIDSRLKGRKVKDLAAISERYFYEDFQAVREGFVKRSMRNLSDFLRVADTSYFGKDSLNQTEQLDIVRAIYSDFKTGVGSNDSARFAKSIVRTMEEADFMAKENGASLAKERGLGTQMVRHRLANKTREGFSKDVFKWADNDLLDDLSFKLPEGMDTEEAIRLLFDGRRGNLSLRRLQARVGMNPSDFMDLVESHVQFSKPDTWTNFHAKYGAGKEGEVDLMGHVMNKVDGRATQSARLSHFGDNGKLLVDHTIEKIAKRGVKEQAIRNATAKLDRAHRFSAGLIDSYSDPFYRPAWAERNNINFYPKLISNAMGNLGAMLLGRVVIDAAISDTAFKAFASKSIGTGLKAGSAANIMKSTANGFLGSLKENRLLAARLGLTVQSVTENMAYQIRGLGESLTYEGLEKMSAYFLRSTGLNALTEGGRIAHTLGAAVDIGENLSGNVKFAELNKNLQRSLKDLGINRNAWNKMRDFVSKHGETDLEYIDLDKMWSSEDRSIRELGDKMSRLFADLEERGTPTTSPRLSAFKAEMNEAGPGRGIFASSVSTFLGFPISVLNNHLKGVMSNFFTLKGFGTAMAYMTTLSSLGILAQSLRDISQGKEPVFDKKSILKGVARGGAGAIYGDLFVTALESDNKRDLAFRLGNMAMGLPISTAADFFGILGSNASKLMSGKDTTVTRDLIRATSKFAGTSHVLFGTLLERGLVERMILTIDPKYNKVYKARRTREEKRGGGYFLPPGE